MKTILKKEIEIDAKYLRLNGYGNDDVPSDAPFVFGEKWEVIIDLDQGRIMNWNFREELTIILKFRDCGEYTLYNRNLEEICHLRDYVPNKLLPPKNGFGDYIEFVIQPDGKLSNWYDCPSLEEFASAKFHACW